jgi:hypothetical protein
MRSPPGAARGRSPPPRVEVGGAGAPGVGRRVALVDLVHGRLEALGELAREAARTRGVRMRRAVGMERHADDERVGPPLGDQRGDRGGARLAALTIVASGVAVRVSALPLATPTRRVPKVESEIGAGGAGRRDGSAHACPASELSMPASMPSSESALS